MIGAPTYPAPSVRPVEVGTLRPGDVVWGIGRDEQRQLCIGEAPLVVQSTARTGNLVRLTLVAPNGEQQTAAWYCGLPAALGARGSEGGAA